MSDIVSQTAEPAAVASGDNAGMGAKERLLALLQKTAAAGGTISPTANPNTEHGYEYVGFGEDVKRDLGILARRNYLEERFFDRVVLCPKCDSHHLNVREICVTCRRSHITREGLLHHFRCGYVGLPAEFVTTQDGGYVCPKCKGKLHHLGSEYDRFGKAFLCRGCGVISENPPVEAVCLACGAHTLADDLVSAPVLSYVLTSRGAAAVRSGCLLDDDEEPVSVADAPVYRRTVMLEFLDNEMKRLQQFNSRFSLLLARSASPPADQKAAPPLSEWLTRLRGFLREADLIGQVADSLYVVIMPQTKRSTAEALRQRISKELGPDSPFDLSTVEIAEPRDLAQALTGLTTRSGAS